MAIKIKASTWRNITGAYVKNSTWRPVKQIYVKVVNTWKSVFLSDPPVVVSKPSFRLLSYSGAAATSPQFLDQSLYGKDGSYTNYTGITGRKITYSDTSDGLVRNTIISGDLFTTGAGVTTSDRLTVDGKYLFYELTVSNGTDVLDSIEAVSDPMLMIKKQPALGSFTTALTGQSSPNSVLTFNYSLENYYYNRIVPSTSKIRWWRSTNTTASGVIVKEETISATTTSSDSSGLMGTSTYTVAASNDNNSYIVVEIIGVSSWTTNNGYGGFFPDYQIASYSSGVIQAPYQFSFGNTLYVGSNGYIGLNNGGIAAGLSGSGRNINIWNEDLVQYRLQEYSDNSNYYLYFRAYRYQSPLVASAINALDYQIKFYTGQQYCDVYLVRKGSSVPIYLDSPGYYKNFVDDVTAGNTSGVLGPFSWSAGSVMRIYFNETSPATTSGISWTSISDTLWKDITTSQIDDSFTSVVTSANQQAAVLTAPVLNSVTPGTQGGLVQANFTGGSGPVYQMFWWGTATAPTTAVTPDGERTFSPLEDATGPSSTATQYMYVRSVSTAGETSVGPSSIASAWSNGVQFNMTSNAVSQNTAPTATATSTGSTSTVKYLDSITWSTGTYTNQASKTSVLLYSTNTAQLSSPNGDTHSLTRTSSPYTIQTSDPAGTPYVFAVRDTVVGTNGTTYYFYSNQITSAKADAVAFSYNAGVGAAGGWSATVVTSQSGASYSIPTTTGYSVNSSTGTVTVTGLGSNVSSSVTVTKSVPGYNDTTAPASGTSSTVTTYTLTYSANGGSSTPSSQTGASGATITLAANAGTRSGFSFGGWNIGGTTYAGSGSYTFGSANATATAIWTAVFVTPTWNGTLPGWTSGSNFQRITTAPANYKWGWTNGTFSFSGSIGTSKGWNWEVRQTASSSGTHQSGSPSYWTHTTSNDTYASVQGTFRPYLISSARGDVTYSTASRFGRVQPYIFGTDGNEYQGPFTGFI